MAVLPDTAYKTFKIAPLTTSIAHHNEFKYMPIHNFSALNVCLALLVNYLYVHVRFRHGIWIKTLFFARFFVFIIYA